MKNVLVVVLLVVVGLLLYFGNRARGPSSVPPAPPAPPAPASTSTPQPPPPTVTTPPPAPEQPAATVTPTPPAPRQPAPTAELPANLLPQLRAAVDAAEQDATAARAAALDALAKRTPAYAALRTGIPKLKAELEAARKTNDTSAKLVISGEYNAARARIAKMESECLATDDGCHAADAKVASVKQELTALEYRIARLNAEAAQAALDRQAKIDAAKVPLPARFHTGDVGTVPPFAVVQVLKGNGMVVRLDGGETVMLVGFGVGDAVTGRRYHIETPARVGKPVTYTTVIGAPNTVFRITPFTPE